MKTHRYLIALAALVALTHSASAAIVYQTGAATGYFVPFSSSTPAGEKYGDSGYLGSGPAKKLTEITIGLSTFASTPQPDGTTDILFTFNNGDPSGMVFGPGTTLYSTTIRNVVLPAVDGTNPSNLYVTIPLPNVMTDGNFNNIGWSVGVQNYSFGGSFGFQNRGDNNVLGFYTNNASHYTAATGSWSLFAFGPRNPQDIANFYAVVSTPEPASMLSVGALGALLARRRR